jgi:hypothetical protein
MYNDGITNKFFMSRRGHHVLGKPSQFISQIPTAHNFPVKRKMWRSSVVDF